MSDEQPDLRLEWWEPDKLEPNPKNWRWHPGQQVDSYRGIKAEVGWAGALLYNEATGRLVDGHLRRDEALADGERVPVLVGSWTETQEDLILGALDPIAAMGEADEQKLGELLQEIEAESGRVLAALAAGGEDALRRVLSETQWTDEDWSDLDEELDDLAGMEDVNIKITVSSMYHDAVVEWLANGEVKTAPGMGKGVLRRCGLL